MHVFFIVLVEKSKTDPTLYRLYFSELLESFTDYRHIFTDGSKDGDKTAVCLLSVNFLTSQNVYLTRHHFLLLN